MMQRAPFRFALCADDYAMAPGVSRGILEALDADALSATSVMTTSPWWPDHAGALRRHIGRADIGLHLNLTMGAPLGAMPTLAPSGVLPGVGTLIRLARRNALPMAELSAEIERQFSRFADVFGRPPDHVDGHQHVHVLGPMQPLILDTLTKRAWRPWLRDSADSPINILRRRTSVAKATGLAFLGGSLRPRARRTGIATNLGFAGYSSFDPKSDFEVLFARYLVAPGRRHLVMCHPGYVDDELRGLDPVVETREQELGFLLSPRFQGALQRQSAVLARMSDMIASAT